MAGRPVVGLDIGTSGVRAAELRLGKGGATLERFGQVALPPGAVRDGEVVDPEAVAGALRELWASARFGTKKVVVGVANQKVVVRQVELPWLPMAELRASLAFQVQDHIPMPVDQAVLDLHPLEERTDANGNRVLRALLVAASRDMVGTTLEAVTRAGLQPSMVDLTSFAVLRSQAHADSGLGAVEAEALVDVGASVTNIVVHQGGVPRFVRILLMGGGDVTTSVADRLGVPVEEAELLKLASGMAPSAGALAADPAGRAVEATGRRVRRGGPRVARLLRRPGRLGAHRPRRGVRRRLPAGRPGRAAVGRDPPAGRGRPAPVAAQARQDRPDRRAARVRRAGRQRPGGPGARGGVMSLADLTGSVSDDVVVGSGTVVLPRVDLLPPEYGEAARFRRVQAGLGLGVVAAVGVVGLLFLHASGAVSDAQADVDTATATQSRLQTEVAGYRDVQARYATATAAQAMLVQAMGTEVRYSTLLDDLARTVPDGVWLTSTQFNQSAPTTTAAAGSALSTAGAIGTVTISGVALVYDDVARWLDAQATQEGFASPYLTTSAAELVNGKKAVTWSATAVLTSDALSGRYTKPGS